MKSKIHQIHVRRSPHGPIHSGLLTFHHTTIPCALGRSGITTQKREGDGATPAGTHDLMFGYFRKERLTRPRCGLSLFEISESDGWCDDPASSCYNGPVKLPFSKSHEVMKRDDQLYDVCLVLDYNISSIVKHRGSAIFFHLEKEGYQPTEGCIAIKREHMLRILPLMSQDTRMIIYP